MPCPTEEIREPLILTPMRGRRGPPHNSGPLIAFDAITGAVTWTAKGDGMYASPMIVELGGIRQIVSIGQQNIVGVAAADGTSLWQYPWAGEGGGMQAITPVIYGGTIIVSRLPRRSDGPQARQARREVGG
jgi:hypothetical protein